MARFLSQCFLLAARVILPHSEVWHRVTGRPTGLILCVAIPCSWGIVIPCTWGAFAPLRQSITVLIAWVISCVGLTAVATVLLLRVNYGTWGIRSDELARTYVTILEVNLTHGISLIICLILHRCVGYRLVRLPVDVTPH
jgi:hypothetical protein